MNATQTTITGDQMLITLEGVDGTGKSSLQHKLLDHLREQGKTVRKTCEPGSPGFHPLQVPERYNTTRHLLGLYLAVMKDTSLPFFLAAPSAAFELIRNGRLSNETQSFVDSTLPIFLDRGVNIPTGLQDLTERYTKVLNRSAALWARLSIASPRDIMRHILMHARDSDDLSPTAAGLLFFTSHAAHVYELLRWDAEYIVSDRYADSQHAFGQVYGCHNWVYKLYNRVTASPDITILLTASRDTLKDRLSRSEQTGRWDGGTQKLDTLMQAQGAYLRRFENDPMNRTVLTISTDDKSPTEVFATCIQELDMTLPSVFSSSASMIAAGQLGLSL